MSILNQPMRIRNQAMRIRIRRRHLNRPIGPTESDATSTSTTTTTTTTTLTTTSNKCTETVLERHNDTGLPLLTQVIYTNGKIMYIHYKPNGNGMVDHLVFL